MEPMAFHLKTIRPADPFIVFFSFVCCVCVASSTSRQSFPITLATDLRAIRPSRSSSKVSRDTYPSKNLLLFLKRKFFFSYPLGMTFNAVLRAIVEDSPTVPTLLTDYILKGNILPGISFFFPRPRFLSHFLTLNYFLEFLVLCPT
jgi:hypothetical protein